MKKKCLECQTEFEAQRESQKYCSQLCYRKHVRKEMQEFYESLSEVSL